MTSVFIGNARAVAAVRRALAGGSPPHAWLFVGPEGVGKATLARWLAQAVNCERNVVGDRSVGARHWEEVLARGDAPEEEDASGSDVAADASPLHHDGAQRSDVEPCGKCAQCRRIERGIHADVMTVSIPAREAKEPQHKEISVDQIREVERAVSLAPFEGRTRVVIFDPADQLSEEAQNAFLKTLEEPPSRALFVLIATREERLLPTIRSRCRRVEFGLVAAGEIEDALKSLTPGPSPDARERGEKSGPEGPGLHSIVIDEEQARVLARLAAGRPGRALEMAADPSHLERRRQALEQARALGSMPMAELMDLAERLARRFREDRNDVFERVAAWLSWWRDVLLVSASGGGSVDGVTAVDMMDALREDASRYERSQVVEFVRALVRCRERLDANVQARIALDALVAAAPRMKTGAGKAK